MRLSINDLTPQAMVPYGASVTPNRKEAETKLMTSPTRRYTMIEAAKLVGVHKDTLRDWLARGLIPEPMRDRRGWRVWTMEEIQRVITWNNEIKPPPPRTTTERRARIREVQHS